MSPAQVTADRLPNRKMGSKKPRERCLPCAEREAAEVEAAETRVTISQTTRLA